VGSTWDLGARHVDSQGFECFEHAKHFLFVSSFEHVNFAINEKYFKKVNDNPNYYVSLMIFQAHKNAISTKDFNLFNPPQNKN
jgi:hypothetical protein